MVAIAFRLFVMAAGFMVGDLPVETGPMSDPAPISQLRPSGYFTGAYPIENEWDEAGEEAFSAWVRTIGEARERKVFRLSQGLRDPRINPLYTAEDDDLHFDLDCAEFAYALRAYFAYKTGRPFSFIANKGRRYRYGNRPERFSDFTQFDDPHRFLRTVLSSVSSGHFRMDSRLEGTDTYPVVVTRESIRPGITYYDPGGHVLVVYRVDEATGDIWMMDGHPDGTLTQKKFSYRMPRGSVRTGGGFRAWRAIHVELVDERTGACRVTRRLNQHSRFYSATEQYQKSYAIGDISLSYHDWVRARVSPDGLPLDPVAGFDRRMTAICGLLNDRLAAVEEARTLGLPQVAEVPPLPRRFYWGDSPFHDYSTAVLDTRLRMALRETERFVTRSLAWAQAADPRLDYRGDELTLEAALNARLAAFAALPQCTVHYTDSTGALRTVELQEVLRRADALSFDPYHCPEWRWGDLATTTDGSAQPLCATDPQRTRTYGRERSIRRRRLLMTRAPAPARWEPPRELARRARTLLAL